MAKPFKNASQHLILNTGVLLSLLTGTLHAETAASKEKTAVQEDKLFQQEVQKISSWWSQERHKDIQRPYTAEKVASLRETLSQEYPSNQMAKKAWAMFSQMQQEGKGGYSHTFGSLGSRSSH